MTASLAISLELTIIAALAWIAWRSQKRAIRAEKHLRDAREVLFAYDHKFDANAQDAHKWRNARDNRRRKKSERTQAQRQPVLAKMAEMRGDG